MRGRWRAPARPGPADGLRCPSYEDLRVQSDVLAFVVGEGSHGHTVLGLALLLSPDPRSSAVERGVRDLVGARLLSMEGGMVVPGPASLGEDSGR